MLSFCYLFFLSTDTATTEIYTLSLHDALPISAPAGHEQHDMTAAADQVHDPFGVVRIGVAEPHEMRIGHAVQDRKSTRLNSSHMSISYAVFCLKKKNIQKKAEYLPKLELV